MSRTRTSVNGAPEGGGRKWGRPKHVPETPRCVVKVDWPTCKAGGVRLDLDAIAFAEYIVGGDAGRPGAATGGGHLVKGRGREPVALFASHPLPAVTSGKQDADFADRWLNRDPLLRGQDGSRWTIQQAWCVYLLRRPKQARVFRRSAKEQNQFRIRLCPEPSAGQALADAGRMEEFARSFMAGVEKDFTDQAARTAHFTWIGAAHFNTEKPHVHIGTRGITVEGEHICFDQKYLRPTAKELEKDPCASSPIEWRARHVLAAMLSNEARRVG